MLIRLKGGTIGLQKMGLMIISTRKSAPFSQTAKNTILANFVIQLQKQVFVCHNIKFQLKTNTDKLICTYTCGKFAAPKTIRKICSIQINLLLFLSQSTLSKYVNFHLRLFYLYQLKYAYISWVKTVVSCK